jgi:hypothetical protein
VILSYPQGALSLNKDKRIMQVKEQKNRRRAIIRGKNIRTSAEYRNIFLTNFSCQCANGILEVFCLSRAIWG